MQIGVRAKGAELQERYAFEAETNYRRLFGVAGTFVPQTAISLQQVGVLFRETIKTGTAETVFSFDNETQGHRKFTVALLIGLDSRETRNEISFTVRGAACVQLSVFDSRGERT